ncbi:XdhC family protein [Roseibium algae]|uniref:XdhC family protein n=1 Tax=Roseibium algae TaxID=3123038 RepID=A0ABU8TI53_9HYPH
MATALREKLKGFGISVEELAWVKAQAGLDLGAITPDEIALSILAEILCIRSKGQRGLSEEANCA